MRVSRQQIETVVSQIAGEIAQTQGVEIVDVEYVKTGAGYYLRVFIDKPDGVGLDDCQRLSEVLSDRLDEVDPIPGPYSLEVSSPGLDRPLKKPADFDRFAGKRVQIKTYAPIDGRKNWQGTLLGRVDDGIEVEVDGARVALPIDAIAKARLVPEF